MIRSLAEFAAAAAKKSEHFLPRRVRGRKYSSACKRASVASALQQAAISCRKAPQGIFDSMKKRLLPWQKPLGALLVGGQVIANQLLHQFVPIQLTDHASGIVVVRDVGRIFCKKVSNDLVDGVVTLLIQSIEHIPDNGSHILFIITGHSEFNGIFAIFRHGDDLLPINMHIIAYFGWGVKPFKGKFFEN